jgi:hypothetical protein
MLTLSRLTALLLFLCLSPAALAQEHQESIVLSASSKMVRWADVYKVRPERPGDPYFHVRVIERQKDWEPWAFKELASHMAVTPKALEASRTGRKAKIYNYKDVEIRGAYHYWLDHPEARADVPVCDIDILSCVKQLQPR